MTIETLESEFAEALTTIATELGIAAERIFGIFVSAQVLMGIIGIVSILLSIFGALFLGWYIRRLCIKRWRCDDGEWVTSGHEEDGVWIPCGVAVVAVIIIRLFTHFIGTYMLKICCPEYTAMQEIITLVIP